MSVQLVAVWRRIGKVGHLTGVAVQIDQRFPTLAVFVHAVFESFCADQPTIMAFDNQVFAPGRSILLFHEWSKAATGQVAGCLDSRVVAQRGQ